MSEINKKRDTNFRRGYRFGLKTATDMIVRFASAYEDSPEVKRALKIIAGEIPLMGLTSSALHGVDELQKEPK